MNNASTEINGKRKKIMWRLSLLALLFVALAFFYWFYFLKGKATTDDAYVNGFVVSVNPEIQGTVVAFFADNSDFVKKGKLLVQLDKTTFEMNLQQEINGLKLRVKEVTALQKKGEAAATQLESHPLIENSKNAVRAAYINLKRTEILAPIDGFIAKRNVEVGKFVKPSDPLMSIISLNNVWVDANFKENQIRDIRIGQEVDLISDLYGDKIIFKGKVSGILPGTGSAFALLPAQNATGNWIKIVQRVPVRISLEKEQLKEYPLLLGLSMHATVNILDQSGQFLKEFYPDSEIASTSIYAIPMDKIDAIINRTIQESK